MKYPIGVQSFEVLRTSNYVYVDKTDLIYDLAQQHVCFLCRPRRFGKSLMLSTLEAYFLGKKELFEGLKIKSLENEWLQYPVFHIDFNGVNFASQEALDNRLDDIVSDWEHQYGIRVKDKNIGDRFAYVLQQAHQQTGRGCVVLIDEYDKPMLDVLGDTQEQINRDILKAFYSVFKLADAHLRFVMLTGVTKFSQVSVFSGFNQPFDISMTPKYEAICGITEQELYTRFADVVDALAMQYGMSADEVRSQLKQRYDGYHFSSQLTDIYNPFSVLNVLATGIFSDYWFASGTPTYLIKLLDKNNTDIIKLTDKYYEPAYFVNYRANTEDPLAMLYQSGYLTIKAVSRMDVEYLYRLGFPNNEVKRGFVTLLYNNYFRSEDSNVTIIKQLVQSLGEGDLEAFCSLFTAYLSSIDYEMRKDKEYHFQYTLYLIFSLMSTYNVVVERHSSQGRADMIVETQKNIYIFEFKLDGSADDALRQIEERGYAKPYLTDSRPITKIGITFGSQSGTIDDWKIA